VLAYVVAMLMLCLVTLISSMQTVTARNIQSWNHTADIYTQLL